MIPRLLSAGVTQICAPVPLGTDAAGELAAFGIAVPDSLASAIAKRRDEYLAGRYCAARALLEAGAAGAGASGRLVVPIGDEGAPEWPPGWVGSITHSHGLAAAAVGRSAELAGIGLDSERIMSADSASRLKEKLLTVSELAAGCRPAGWSEADWVTLVFSAKETIYKCIRPLCGNFFGFQDAELVKVEQPVSDHASGAFAFRLTRAIGGPFKAGWQSEGRFTRAEGWIHTAMELPRDRLPA